MHGARGGAPKGKRNGNYRHGERTLEVKEVHQKLRELLANARSVLKNFDAES